MKLIKVSAPAFVPKIDWIDNVWPKELFKRQENLLRKSSWARDQDFSTYPKVQRFNFFFFFVVLSF